jgi:predicted ester cyclase
MSDDPRVITRRFHEEVISGHGVGGVAALVAEDSVDHIPLPGPGPGRDGITQALALVCEGGPDMRLEVVEELTERELVAQVVRITRTNDGPSMGMPPTGMKVSVLGADVLRVLDGRVLEHWGVYDQGSLMAHLGLQPPG